MLSEVIKDICLKLYEPFNLFIGLEKLPKTLIYPVS